MSRKKLTLQEYLMGRDKQNPITLDQLNNANKLLLAVNSLLAHYNKPVTISSGYRPMSINAKVGGAKLSAHITCEAVDIADPNQELANWCLNNIPLLEKYELYLENPAHTPTWVHLQIRKPRSGNRIFNP